MLGLCICTLLIVFEPRTLSLRSLQFTAERDNKELNEEIRRKVEKLISSIKYSDG